MRAVRQGFPCGALHPLRLTACGVTRIRTHARLCGGWGHQKSTNQFECIALPLIPFLRVSTRVNLPPHGASPAPHLRFPTPSPPYLLHPHRVTLPCTLVLPARSLSVAGALTSTRGDRCHRHTGSFDAPGGSGFRGWRRGVDQNRTAGRGRYRVHTAEGRGGQNQAGSA